MYEAYKKQVKPKPGTGVVTIGDPRPAVLPKGLRAQGWSVGERRYVDVLIPETFITMLIADYMVVKKEVLQANKLAPNAPPLPPGFLDPKPVKGKSIVSGRGGVLSKGVVDGQAVRGVGLEPLGRDVIQSGGVSEEREGVHGKLAATEVVLGSKDEAALPARNVAVVEG